MCGWRNVVWDAECSRVSLLKISFVPTQDTVRYVRKNLVVKAQGWDAGDLVLFLAWHLTSCVSSNCFSFSVSHL